MEKPLSVVQDNDQRHIQFDCHFNSSNDHPQQHAVAFNDHSFKNDDISTRDRAETFNFCSKMPNDQREIGADRHINNLNDVHVNSEKNSSSDKSIVDICVELSSTLAKRVDYLQQEVLFLKQSIYQKSHNDDVTSAASVSVNPAAAHFCKVGQEDLKTVQRYIFQRFEDRLEPLSLDINNIQDGIRLVNENFCNIEEQMEVRIRRLEQKFGMLNQFTCSSDSFINRRDFRSELRHLVIETLDKLRYEAMEKSVSQESMGLCHTSSGQHQPYLSRKDHSLSRSSLSSNRLGVVGKSDPSSVYNPLSVNGYQSTSLIGGRSNYDPFDNSHSVSSIYDPPITNANNVVTGSTVGVLSTATTVLDHRNMKLASDPLEWMDSNNRYQRQSSSSCDISYPNTLEYKNHYDVRKIGNASFSCNRNLSNSSTLSGVKSDLCNNATNLMERSFSQSSTQPSSYYYSPGTLSQSSSQQSLNNGPFSLALPPSSSRIFTNTNSVTQCCYPHTSSSSINEVFKSVDDWTIDVVNSLMDPADKIDLSGSLSDTSKQITRLKSDHSSIPCQQNDRHSSDSNLKDITVIPNSISSTTTPNGGIQNCWARIATASRISQRSSDPINSSITVSTVIAPTSPLPASTVTQYPRPQLPQQGTNPSDCHNQSAVPSRLVQSSPISHEVDEDGFTTVTRKSTSKKKMAEINCDGVGSMQQQSALRSNSVGSSARSAENVLSEKARRIRVILCGRSGANHENCLKALLPLKLGCRKDLGCFVDQLGVALVEHPQRSKIFAQLCVRPRDFVDKNSFDSEFFRPRVLNLWQSLYEQTVTNWQTGYETRLQGIIDFMCRLTERTFFSEKLRLRVLKLIENDPTEGRLKSLLFMLTCGKGTLPIMMPEAWTSIIEASRTICDNTMSHKGKGATIVQAVRLQLELLHQ